MSLSLEDVSIVYWFPDRDKHKCGYCKQENSGCSYGMWADSLTVDDYQDIMDRGWRRSGKYCYKPIMKETCCPQYTIRCDTGSFKLSKSQKKVIKKFNKWLHDGLNKETVCVMEKSPEEVENENVEMDEAHINHIMFKERPECINDYKQIDKKLKIEMKDELIKDKSESEKNDLNVEPSCSNNLENYLGNVEMKDLGVKQSRYKKGDGADPKKPLQQKAKVLRLERKRKKMEEKGLSIDNHNQSMGQEVKTLKNFLEEIADNPKHKLEIKLYSTSQPDDDLTTVMNIEHNVYQKYQTIVHDDPPEKCCLHNFKRFLIQTPLKPKESGVNGITYGSYHQQYWIDGNLIAVGVIDILPRCVSSVYFFYDPDYRNLTLGTYGSLREVEFTQELNKKLPDLKYYYMGFYIHSCSKMRYKGKLNPSDLLCPETFEWFPIGKCIPKLDVSKYSRLNENLSAKDVGVCKQSDIESIKILIGYQYTTFRHYRYKSRDLHMYQMIGALIGRKCIDRFMIIQQNS
ncbi:arginyl-tRNA--protein transferase 1 isoform X2 [Onthophagus taurus]|uniref:arginyl-tRNA--protein transferase 1 isoform X2 n=1 Tax=Onthophagus taurus TaxID=166361 RepID=UPI0039BDD7C6